MPCNIGYRQVVKARLPVNNEESIKEQTEAKIDQSLLEQIGEPDFIEWLLDLDIESLLGEALRRALAKIKPDSKIKFSLKGFYLEAEAKDLTSVQKRGLGKVIDKTFNQFQMEIFGIIAQLLDYEIMFSVDGNNLVLEGEKMEDKNVHKYLKILKDINGQAEIQFEHFSSERELEQEEAKFVALAQKMGIKIVVKNREINGKPIPNGVYHANFLREKN